MNPAARNQAITLFNQSLSLVERDKAMAYRMLSASVDVDPQFHEGWYNIGCADYDMGLRHGAIACMRRVLEIEPGNIRAWINLGHNLYHLGRIDAARKAIEKALEIDGEDAYALLNMSMIESVAGKNALALKYAQRAYVKDCDPVIAIQLAFAYMFSGDWANGLKAFEARYQYKLQEFTQYHYVPWDGGEIDTLLVPADQGIGDAICFSRFIPEAAKRAKKIILSVHPEIVRLFRALLQDFENVEITPLPHSFPAADAWVSLTSLPVAMGLTTKQIEDAPWLEMPNFVLPSTWKVPGRKLHIGIHWSGSSLNDIDRWRSMKIEHFLELYHVQGIQLYSLQVGQPAQEIQTAGASALIKDLSQQIRDVTDTIALMREMDLIVCIESSVQWMAAAMGKPCFMAYSYNGGDYRSGRNRKHTLWAPTTTIFKQGPDGEWGPVVDAIVGAVRELVK